MKQLLSVFIFFILAGAAHAEPVNEHAFCQTLVDYQQPAGVEYEPGVDVHGKPVAPADLSGQRTLQNFDTIQIPVTVDLAERFNLTPPDGVELEPYVALISIHKNGKVEYNGQDISQQAYSLCNDKDLKNEQAGTGK